MKLRFLFAPVLLLGCFFLFAIACAEYQPKEAVGAQTTPGANGKELWDYITKDSNYTGWQFWPGKEALYKGTEPHGALLTTYVNTSALKAINDKAGVLPNGAIIVKENYKPDETMVAVTVMYKVAGYNPEAGNWFWAKYSPEGEVMNGGMAQGKVPMCIACHEGRRDNDYIITGDIR